MVLHQQLSDIKQTTDKVYLLLLYLLVRKSNFWHILVSVLLLLIKGMKFMSLLNPVKFNQGMKQYQSKKQNRQITLPQKQITHSSKRNHRQYEFTIVLIDCRNYTFPFHRLRMSYILLEVVFFTFPYAHNTSCLLCLSHNIFWIYSYRLFFHTRVFILNT